MLTNLRLLESMLTVHRRVNKNTERCYEDMTVNGQNKLCPSFLLVYLKLNIENRKSQVSLPKWIYEMNHMLSPTFNTISRINMNLS